MYMPFQPASSFTSFQYDASSVDLQGWQGDAPILCESIVARNAKRVLDVGVWKGQSTINMAKTLKDNNIDGKVYAVDTWLGNPEMWLDSVDPNHFASLKCVNGYPSFYYTFLANVFDNAVQDYIIPVPSTSESAYHMFSTLGYTFDVIHIDAAHQYEPAKRDMENYWNLVTPGGVMICDDYSQNWPSVVKAVDDFAKDRNLSIEATQLKAVIVKK
jgi:predicted O-methyltransferase YrrM